MPSGPIFENRSKIYRKYIEHLSNIYRKSIANLSQTIYRKSIEHLSNGGLLWGYLGVTLGFFGGLLWGQIGVTFGPNLIHRDDFGALCEPFRRRRAIAKNDDLSCLVF